MATELTPIITYMTLDLATTNNFDFVKAVQGDHETRYIYITLLNDSVPYELNCESIILRGTKPDGTGVFNYCNLSENGEVIVELTGQLLAVSGIGKYEIALYGQAEVNEEVDALTTFPFRIVVDKANIDTEVITSTNEFKAITEIMGNAETLKKSMDTIQEAKTSALQSKEAAALSAENAANSAGNASISEINAKASEQASKKSETNAASSASNALTNAAEAANKANDAAQSADTAAQKSEDALNYAIEAESYAQGGTGMRENEDIDNAKYYYQQSKSISESFAGALRPMGTVTFANLPVLASAVEGDMYNVSDQFTTTVSFKEGSGNIIPAGANIYKTADGYWDVLAGSPVTGVKGNAENTYHRGNVNLTPANLGITIVNNTADANKTVKSAGTCTGNSATATKLATARTIALTGSVTGSGKFDGSGNLSITTATNHTHNYLPLSGGTLTGTLGTPNLCCNSVHLGNGTNSSNVYLSGANGNSNTATGRLACPSFFNIQCPRLQIRDYADNAWAGISASSFTTQGNSSKMLKNNIKDITDERAKQILDVKVVTFDYKEGIVTEDHRYDRTGVIAEDTESICPEVINYDNNNPSGVQYDRFIPYLIKMVQMQQEEIEQLKSRLENLQTN